MNDNFYPSVTWGVPVSDSNVPQLSSIHRDQSFTTWLVAINQATSETLVLQTIRWRMRLHVRVDPEKPLGHRAVLKEPLAQEQPQIQGKNEPIPTNAMVKPNANDAQVLMWRPKNGDPVVVIPPKYWPVSRTCFTDQTGLGYLNSIISYLFSFFCSCLSPAVTALTLSLFLPLYSFLFKKTTTDRLEKNRQRQMKPALRKETSCCFEVAAWTHLKLERTNCNHSTFKLGRVALC